LQVFTNIPRTVTLLTASEQLATVSFVRALKHQLIATASTGVASLAMYVSTNGSDLPFLLLHECSLPAGDLRYCGLQSDSSDLIENKDGQQPDRAK
jgi:hypothetical protein